MPAALQELTTLHQQVSSLHQLTRAVNTTLHVEQVVSAAATHTRAALNAHGVVIWLVDDAPAGTPLRVHRHDGFAGRAEALDFLSQQTASECVMLVPLPQLLGETPGPQGTCLVAPLRWQQSLTGRIGVVRWGGRFDKQGAGVLKSVGLEIGTAIENARLYRAALEAA